MAVTTPVALDRARVQELIDEEAAALDARTQQSAATYERAGPGEQAPAILTAVTLLRL